MRNKKIKKEISNTGLSIMIENLAGMVARGFDRVDKKFESVYGRLSNLEEGQKKIRGDILGLGDRFPSRFEFDKSLARIHKLEGK